jgi:hypothetical protein
MENDITSLVINSGGAAVVAFIAFYYFHKKDKLFTETIISVQQNFQKAIDELRDSVKKHK